VTHNKYDYLVARQLQERNPPFNALIMAAFLQADSTNWAKLNVMFPDISQWLADVDAEGVRVQ